MKFNHIEIEATVEELEASPVLVKLLTGLARRSSESHEYDDEFESADDESREHTNVDGADVPGVASAGQSVVKAQLASNPAAEHFRRFLAEASGWPDVAVHGIKPKGSQAGAPLDYTRYLRIRRTGSQLGGFAYVYAVDGHVNFRLAFDSNEELHSIAPGAWRPTTGHRAYRVSIRIIDQSTLDQALQLARTAYERT
ncbi:hypothetical protein [Arthrobacter sp. 131MFCol6.1]|uniref:hypothetical protein n=1 Tax=Arthrobacter sp. 131MFCol6.1 TaxID=1157944 RepID=UPI0012DC76CC|nr:hypothetical protein [Arthrobacter sp. 131MFCol6.1]